MEATGFEEVDYRNKRNGETRLSLALKKLQPAGATAV